MIDLHRPTQGNLPVNSHEATQGVGRCGPAMLICLLEKPPMPQLRAIFFAMLQHQIHSWSARRKVVLWKKDPSLGLPIWEFITAMFTLGWKIVGPTFGHLDRYQFLFQRLCVVQAIWYTVRNL